MICIFATCGYLKAMPFAFIILCLARDVLLALGGFTMMNSTHRNKPLATKAGKINTLLQILYIIIVLYRLQASSVSSLFLFSETVLIALTSLFTTASGICYAKTFWRFLKNS